MYVNQVVITRDGAEAMQIAEAMEGAVTEYSAALDVYIVYDSNLRVTEYSDTITFAKEKKNRACRRA